MQRASSLVLVHIFSYWQALWLITGVILPGEVRYWPHAAQHSAHWKQNWKAANIRSAVFSDLQCHLTQNPLETFLFQYLVWHMSHSATDTIAISNLTLCLTARKTQQQKNSRMWVNVLCLICSFHTSSQHLASGILLLVYHIQSVRKTPLYTTKSNYKTVFPLPHHKSTGNSSNLE